MNFAKDPNWERTEPFWRKRRELESQIDRIDREIASILLPPVPHLSSLITGRLGEMLTHWSQHSLPVHPLTKEQQVIADELAARMAHDLEDACINPGFSFQTDFEPPDFREQWERNLWATLSI